MNKNVIITILAIIGGLVVLGWLLKFSFKLIGILLLIGIGVVIYQVVTAMMGKSR